jgi:hypothetical protein
MHIRRTVATTLWCTGQNVFQLSLPSTAELSYLPRGLAHLPSCTPILPSVSVSGPLGTSWRDPRIVSCVGLRSLAEPGVPSSRSPGPCCTRCRKLLPSSGLSDVIFADPSVSPLGKENHSSLPMCRRPGWTRTGHCTRTGEMVMGMREKQPYSVPVTPAAPQPAPWALASPQPLVCLFIRRDEVGERPGVAWGDSQPGMFQYD